MLHKYANAEGSQGQDLGSGSLAVEPVLMGSTGNIKIKELEGEKFSIIVKY